VGRAQSAQQRIRPRLIYLSHLLFSIAMGRRARNKQGDPAPYVEPGAAKSAAPVGKKRKAEDQPGRSATKKQKATSKSAATRVGSKASTKAKAKPAASDSDNTGEDDDELLPDADEIWSDEVGDEYVRDCACARNFHS